MRARGASRSLRRARLGHDGEREDRGLREREATSTSALAVSSPYASCGPSAPRRTWAMATPGTCRCERSAFDARAAGAPRHARTPGERRGGHGEEGASSQLHGRSRGARRVHARAWDQFRLAFAMLGRRRSCATFISEGLMSLTCWATVHWLPQLSTSDPSGRPRTCRRAASSRSPRVDRALEERVDVLGVHQWPALPGRRPSRGRCRSRRWRSRRSRAGHARSSCRGSGAQDTSTAPNAFLYSSIASAAPSIGRCRHRAQTLGTPLTFGMNHLLGGEGVTPRRGAIKAREQAAARRARTVAPPPRVPSPSPWISPSRRSRGARGSRTPGSGLPSEPGHRFDTRPITVWSQMTGRCRQRRSVMIRIASFGEVSRSDADDVPRHDVGDLGLRRIPRSRSTRVSMSRSERIPSTSSSSFMMRSAPTWWRHISFTAVSAVSLGLALRMSVPFVAMIGPVFPWQPPLFQSSRPHLEGSAFAKESQGSERPPRRLATLERARPTSVRQHLKRRLLLALSVGAAVSARRRAGIGETSAGVVPQAVTKHDQAPDAHVHVQASIAPYPIESY